jgi:hypothetical protein
VIGPAGVTIGRGHRSYGVDISYGADIEPGPVEVAVLAEIATSCAGDSPLAPLPLGLLADLTCDEGTLVWPPLCQINQEQRSSRAAP